jgi:putative acetyltransferase
MPISTDQRSVGSVSIRAETAADIDAIHAVETAAFGRDDEAVLVDALRRLNEDFISLVAVTGPEIVGHISFSRVTIEHENAHFAALALAPLAVAPQHQRHGIGGMLVREGLEECRRQQGKAVFVVGDPSYYSRFGFCPGNGFAVECEFSVPSEAFMALELIPGALRERRGRLRYPRPFHEVT